MAPCSALHFETQFRRWLLGEFLFFLAGSKEAELAFGFL